MSNTAVQLVIGEDRKHLDAEVVMRGDLLPGCKVTPVSLEITDPDFKLDDWLSLGRLKGYIHRAINWWLGDWINFGEHYGEEGSQGIDSIHERYNEAERITGVDHSTLLNISSICRKIPKSRRRKELGFWIHAEVAPMEPDDQKEWLQKAIENLWNRAQLRDAIREARNPGEPEPDPVPDDGGSGGGLSIGERIEQAARLCYHQAQRGSDGSAIVPPEPFAQLAAALGEE